jgi:hypothetical protein
VLLGEAQRARAIVSAAHRPARQVA